MIEQDSYKREELLREVELFEINHDTVLKEFRKQNHFPNIGKKGIIERLKIRLKLV